MKKAIVLTEMVGYSILFYHFSILLYKILKFWNFMKTDIFETFWKFYHFEIFRNFWNIDIFWKFWALNILFLLILEFWNFMYFLIFLGNLHSIMAFTGPLCIKSHNRPAKHSWRKIMFLLYKYKPVCSIHSITYWLIIPSYISVLAFYKHVENNSMTASLH